MEFPHRRRTPSFSSSLLDAIYRSIDESDGLGGSKTINTVPSPINKNHVNNKKSLRRAIMNEENDWALQWRSRSYGGRTHHSASSSSDSSSSAATFSSSEVESYEKDKRSTKPDPKLVAQGRRFDLDNEKPKKTLKAGLDEIKLSKKIDSSKLQAMKMYEEIKKSKQPVSPGARLTSFLNSIFQSNAKKVKLCSAGASKDVSFDRNSKLSSSSRSCFNKTRRNSNDSNTTTTTNNNNNGMRRSVRFYPVRVLVDEDSRSCGRKDVQHVKDLDLVSGFTGKKRCSSLKDELKFHGRGMTCNTSKFDLKHFVGRYDKDNVDDEEEEEGDTWSYSSSDLFELDHRIGIACRYREELPVYETTDLKTNQAIARGLIL